MKEHEIYMMNKVLENLLGKSVEQRFEEIEVEEVRARRQAEIDAEMKYKGKGVEGVSEIAERSIVPSSVSESPIQNPRPISVVSGIFEEDVLLDDVINEEDDIEEDDDEEDDDEEKADDADDVFSASSHSDNDDDDNGQGGTGVKVTEASNEENVEDYLHDDANEEPEDATGEGENVEDQNVDKKEKLILRLEPEVEEGEIRHTYTMNDIIEMTRIDDPNFKFDFEEELNAFDMNQQPEYQYKYVDEADNYDRVEVEDCSDEENVNVDTSHFPTLVELIDILKVKVVELEEEKARRDEQNKYFELKNKELEAAKAMKEHEIYMMNKVLENLLGKSVEQRFEEIEVEEVRARRQAEIDAEMKYKGKGVEGVSEIAERSIVPSSVSESPIQNPRPISVVSGIFEEDVLLDDVINEEDDIEEDDDEEDDDEEKADDADDVFSASSHSDNDDDDNGQGGTGVKVTEASNEENVEDYLHDDANEEPEDATGEGENVEDQNVDKKEKLILRLEPEVEEGEIRHTYTMNDIIEMTRIDDPNFKFDFEEELNAFDMNQQPEYQYKYVDEADNYDRVEVEDCSDEENVNVDTSHFPTLVELIDILKVKVVELEEEKARRDEQNKYFELKNKELEAAKAMKEHEIYMMNKVLENLLGKSVEQRFEEIEVEEVRA
ncbi:probable serine/threonine-protein kinase kinX [Helianthus annuus]|uniref:probable serine/threonine-protein kinase kinX n=1 Tax=Helianthus annuus TaxID=4232 RepID=UPI000B8FE90C|nr:probable serine/threonine-protein kinase kinX [Helianthus annuus]